MANVLITGCSSGFGLLTALEFARKGDHVFATMRNPNKAVELERTRDAEKLPIEVLQLDILDDASVSRAVAEATKRGPIDVLVNNAGMELRAPIEEADDEEVRKQFDTNVFGTLRVIRAVLPAMRERKAGTIVNLSSIGGIVAPPYAGFYAATKHALEAISEAMHYELASFGVRVIVIEPGGFATAFRDNAFNARRFNESSPYWDLSQRFGVALDRLTRPEGPPADPGDVARTIVAAVSEEKPKLRYLVGNDANLIATVRKQTDFEGFEAAMRQTLDWHD
jgi:NAD(P)-dependent dehydrogenase (short-subunit alcohol dehydrogenase family)